MFSIGPIDKEEYEVIAKLIFTKAANLLEIYFDQPGSVASILEMLLVFSYQDGSTCQYRTVRILRTFYLHNYIHIRSPFPEYTKDYGNIGTIFYRHT